MAIGDTAQLAVELNLGGTYNAGISSATAKTAEFNAVASRGVGASGILSGAFSKVGGAANLVGGALNHAGSQLKGLITGPLGMIGLTGGLLSVGGALTATLGKMNDLAFGTEKLKAITGDSAQVTSTIIAASDKYGISLDKLTVVAGFYEKTVGKLSETTAKSATATKSAELQNLELVKAQRVAAGLSTTAIDKLIKEQKARDAVAAATAAQLDPLTKLDALQKQFSVVLTDSTGKALPFSQALLSVADAYTKTTDKAQADYLAAQLFGRGYTALVPILALGRQGIIDLETEAAKMGLQLSDANVADFAKYRAALRASQESISGLQVAIGEELLPTITDLANGLSSFVAEHKGDILRFVQGAIDAAKSAGSAIGSIVGTVVGAWNSIPSEFRDLILKGFIADKTVKFLFGFDPAGAGLNAIKTAIVSAMGQGIAKGAVTAGIGKLFVQPVFVTNPGFGGPGNVLSAAEGAAGAAGLSGIEAVGISAGVVALGPILLAAAPLIAIAVAAAVLGQDKGPTNVQGSTTQNGMSPKDPRNRPGGAPTTHGPFNTGLPGPVNTMPVGQHAANEIVPVSDLQSHGLLLSLAQKTDIRKDIDQTTKKSLADILARAKAVGENPTRTTVDETFQTNLLFAARETATSGETQAQKITDLKTLQQRLLSNGTAGDRATAGKIDGLITAVKDQGQKPIDVTLNATISISASAIAKGNIQYQRAGNRLVGRDGAAVAF